VTHPFAKILALMALLIGGMALASLCMIVIALAQGVDLAVLMESFTTGESKLPVSVLRSMLWVQAIAGFLIPSFIFGLLFYRRNWKEYFMIHRAPSLVVLICGIVALFASYPLVQLSFELNSAIPLPDWMTEMEDNAAEVLKEILVMETFGSFLLTVILVAILPGIGEELVFRGILQKQLEAWTRNPVVAVWIAAIIFSGIHMQFEGFLPRVVLGAVLGYIYLWSRNLWVPIAAHALNNGMQVAVLYYTGVDLSNIEKEPQMDLNVWVIVLSILVLYGCYHLMKQSAKEPV
jgi:membrane protease YdiL (CAAX protease family)